MRLLDHLKVKCFITFKQIKATNNIDAIERIQHRATRMVKNLRKLPYEERLRRLDITTLEKRRKRSDLIQFFKIFNKFEKVDLVNVPEFRQSANQPEATG